MFIVVFVLIYLIYFLIEESFLLGLVYFGIYVGGFVYGSVKRFFFRNFINKVVWR